MSTSEVAGVGPCRGARSRTDRADRTTTTRVTAPRARIVGDEPGRLRVEGGGRRVRAALLDRQSLLEEYELEVMAPPRSGAAGEGTTRTPTDADAYAA